MMHWNRFESYLNIQICIEEYRNTVTDEGQEGKHITG